MTKNLLLLAIACLCPFVHVHAVTYSIYIGDLWYSVDTETLEASVAASNDISGDVVIPASIDADPDNVMRTYIVTSIGEDAFYCCTSLASVTIPESVTSIGSGAFEDCTSLTSVTLSESVTSIGDYAFSGCTSLQSIAIPNSVTSIGSRAFSGCTSLASVTIPESVTSIRDYAFSGCTNLEKIYCMWETPITCNRSVWDDANYSNATLYVPKGFIAAYQLTTPWAWFLNIETHSLAGINPTAIVDGNAKTVVATYDISGKPVAPDTKGLVIVRYSDGSVAKVINRDR